MGKPTGQVDAAGVVVADTSALAAPTWIGRPAPSGSQRQALGSAREERREAERTMSSEQYPSSAEAPSSPRCYRHPDRETYVRCTRCDRPICPDCLRPAAVGFQCPECVAAGNRGVRRPATAFGARITPRTGWITGTLITINVTMFLATAFSSPTGFRHNTSSDLFFRTQLQPFQVAAFDEYYRMVTSAFLHVGMFHLLLNMVALAIVGFDLERVLGPWRYLSVYMLSALGGSVAVYLFGNEATPVAGASGAIFGLFGAILVVVRRMGADSRAILATIGINVVFSFSIPNISWLGHLGGLAVGLLATAAIAYAPAGPRRSLMQAGGLLIILGMLILLVVYRTPQIA